MVYLPKRPIPRPPRPPSLLLPAPMPGGRARVLVWSLRACPTLASIWPIVGGLMIERGFGGWISAMSSRLPPDGHGAKIQHRRQVASEAPTHGRMGLHAQALNLLAAEKRTQVHNVAAVAFDLGRESPDDCDPLRARNPHATTDRIPCRVQHAQPGFTILQLSD